MDQLEHNITCPFCWQVLDILIDPYQESEFEHFDYIEDCQVCCNPISILVFHDADGGLQVKAEQGQ